jgi:hypothetical protein
MQSALQNGIGELECFIQELAKTSLRWFWLEIRAERQLCPTKY